MKKLFATTLAPLLAMSTACAVDTDMDDSNVGEIESLVAGENGTSLNGTSLNGTSLNGTSLNGTSLNGTSLNGTSSGGSSITAGSSTAPPLSGADKVGSTWTGTAANGATITLRIDAAEQLVAPNSEVWAYAVSYQTSAGWQPLCGLDGLGAPIKAVSVAGTWSTTTATWATSSTKFTFACRGKAISKCVELGYKTYKGYANQMNSCIRMLRADYCGNGVSYTTNGTLLNLFDNLNIQVDTQAWTKEGAWGPAGAKCLRTGGKIRYVLYGTGTPSCAAALYTSTCANTFATGQYIINEVE